MEASGLVERELDQNDRRVVRIRATVKGKRILEDGRDRRIAVIADELAMMPDADVKAIVRALDAIEKVAGTPNRRSLTV